MNSLTVRNLPEGAKQRFRQVAAAHGRSMEEHLRQLIIEADQPTAGVRDAGRNFQHLEPVPADPKAASRARIERLMALGRGIDWEPEPREAENFRDHDWFK